MIIVPKERPIIYNLNTYYLDIKKLIEHYQGEIGAGGCFFKSVNAEGVVFFDQDELLNGFFQDRDGHLEGNDAIQKLMEETVNYNFTVSIYKIAIEEVYLWSSLTSAEKIYKDLSTEFTDLEGLIKKMSSEKLTGFIDVAINGENEEGLIFISNGEIIGGSYSLAKEQKLSSKKSLELLIHNSKKYGGIFQVSRIPMNENQQSIYDYNENYTAPSSDIIKILEDFLGIFETLYVSKKMKKKPGFKNTLNKKFIDNAEKYSFLDPFAGEFTYNDRKITFTGDARENEILKGVYYSVNELATELDLFEEFKQYLTPWFNKYENTLVESGITI